MRSNNKNLFYLIILSGYLLMLINNCKEESVTTPPLVKKIPTVTTTDLTNITLSSALSGGNVTSDGGATVTGRGVCWSTTVNPTISDNKTTDSSGTGSFTSLITGLSLGTKYYVRAYATNSVGTAYGEQGNFTTRATLQIGDSFAGGYIFYLDSTGMHGFVCATEDQGGGYVKWGCPDVELKFAKGTALGTGAINTANIVNACKTKYIAAWFCSELVLNGYDDWFLPSKDELKLIYTNLKATGLKKFSNGYWTSTDGGVSSWVYYAYMVVFNNGNEQMSGKDGYLYVRAVRAF
jgi:hypothetical protein